MRKLLSLLSSRGVRVGLAVAVVAATVVTVMNLDHRTEKQRAEAWAARHAAPASLEALAAYPAAYRQALFSALPPAEQSRLWREQFQIVLDTETLTPAQRAFVVKAMDMVTPASFAKDAPHPEVCTDIAQLFTNPKQKEKVRTIASFATPSRTAGALWVNATERIRSAVNVKAAYPCSCSGLGICECGLLMTCVYGDCETNNNCGCIWAGECDKMCQSPLPKMQKVNTGGK